MQSILLRRVFISKLNHIKCIKSLFNITNYNLSTVNIVKITSPEFESILTNELKYLESVFSKYNYKLKIAGGAVRDLLSGI